MMVLFEVYAEGPGSESLLSAEVKADTQAVEFSVEQAEKLGFAGLPEAMKEAQPRLIAVRPNDAGYIRHKLEQHPEVQRFQMHDVDG